MIQVLKSHYLQTDELTCLFPFNTASKKGTEKIWVAFNL